jgi:hypothetical protein
VSAEHTAEQPRTATTVSAPRFWFALALALALGALLLAAGSAAAASPLNFCPPGTAAAHCVGPTGVAVDQSSGHVYIADQVNNRIDVFDASGKFLQAFGWGVLNGAPEPQVCSTACEPGIPGSGPGQMYNPSSLAVDNSPGPSAGDLYVFDRQEGRVQKFSPAGEFLLTFGSGVLDGGATGSGDLTAGSTKVTSVATTSRAFHVGQTITGAGIPPNTKIADLPQFGSTFILSQPATATATAVSLTAPTPPTNNPANEVLTLTTGGASGGTFQLLFAGVAPEEHLLATSSMPYSATAALVQERLEALVNIGPGNVAVSGPSAGPWTVEFKGALADTRVAPILLEHNGLVPPSNRSPFGHIIQRAGGPETCTKADVTAGYLCLDGAGGDGLGGVIGGSPLALDTTGHAWVGIVDGLRQYGEGGEFLSEVKLPGYGEIAGLAVAASGDFYVLTAATGANESQLLSFPRSGSYTLTFDGETTAPIAGSPSTLVEGARVQAALEALPSVGPNNFKEQTGEYEEIIEVEFTGALGFKDVEQITASAGASVETLVQGQSAHPSALSKLKPSGELLETFDQGPPFGHPAALALDPASGALFVSDQVEPGQFDPQGQAKGPATLLAYSSAGALTEVFGTGSVIGAPQGNALAFGVGAQSLYVVSRLPGSLSAAQLFSLPEPGPLPEEAGEEAKPVGKLSATLNASVNPEGASTTVHFQYVDQESFEAEGGFAGPHVKESSESPPIGADFTYHPAAVAIAGLSPETSYRFRVIATNANGTVLGKGAAFTTEPPVRLDATYATGVSAGSALLNAQLNPLGDAGEYRFEYLTQASYVANGDSFSGPNAPTAAPLPDGRFAAGEAELTVAQPLQGLLPATAYRFRVIAHNQIGEVDGPAVSFTTQGPVGPALPDGRGWELVSPPDKNGVPLEALGGIDGDGTPIQAAADGTALAYVASGAITDETPGDRSFSLSQFLARRSATGWSTRDLTTPHQAPVGLKPGTISEYAFFSPDLSLAALEPEGATPLSPLTTERTPYLRQPSGEYTPLVTAENVPSGTKFGGTEIFPEEFAEGVTFESATPDLSHVVLESPQALTAGSAGGGHRSLYVWSAGTLELLSQIPSAPATAVCGEAGPACVPAAKKGLDSTLRSGNEVIRNAFSTDGSRVVFTSSLSTEFRLFLRDIGRGETLRLDLTQPGALGGQGVAIFQAASSDDSTILFTDGSRLTADSTASAGQPDLYRCQVEESAGHLACALSDLTVDHNPGEHANVRGILIGASADGSAVYFAAAGALAPGAEPGTCGDSAGEACNIYLYRDGATSFIARVSGLDRSDWGPVLSGLTARVSPDGRWLAFMSSRPLTGYDNRDAHSGEPAQEVYLYHAAAATGEAGSLLCASCNPTGARPAAILDQAIPPGLLVDRVGLWMGQRLAASIPTWTPFFRTTFPYQSRNLSNSGRLFFDAADSLVPSDSNGREDVYQYEPPGVGGCRESSASFHEVSAGCIDLISTGASGEESAFLDASETGDDVFFLTESKLAPADFDGALDIYDAHVCTADEPCPPPPPTPAPACEGDACQAPAVPPSDPTPGSLTFQGAGNIHESKPKKKHKKHRKSHKKHNKRAGSSRGGHK